MSERELAEKLLAEAEGQRGEIDYEEVKILLEQGSDPLYCDENSRTALLVAVEEGDEVLLSILLNHCAKSEKLYSLRTPDGLNALQLASALGHTECVSLLLLSAAFNQRKVINLLSPEGDSSLHLALSSGYLDIAFMLLENGIDPHLCDSRGRHPVHMAARIGNVAFLEALSSRGVDFSVLDHAGNSALHCCVDWYALNFLYQQGTNPLQRNSFGHTPAENARKLGFDHLVSPLKRLEQRELVKQHIEGSSLLTATIKKIGLFVKDVVQQLGWKSSVLILVACGLVAWYLALYIHGQNPFVVRPFPTKDHIK